MIPVLSCTEAPLSMPPLFSHRVHQEQNQRKRCQNKSNQKGQSVIPRHECSCLGVSAQKSILEDEHLFKANNRICKRPSGLKASASYTSINWEKQIEHRITSVRCKVEHTFLIVKRDFSYRKVVYRGIAENMARFMHIQGLNTQFYQDVLL